MEPDDKQLQTQFDPNQYMTPSQREIVELSKDELLAEYLLIEAKKSKRSRMQRDFIVTRYQFDLLKKQNEDDTV